MSSLIPGDLLMAKPGPSSDIAVFMAWQLDRSNFVLLDFDEIVMALEPQFRELHQDRIIVLTSHGVKMIDISIGLYHFDKII